MRRLGVVTLLGLSLLGCGGKSNSSGNEGGNGSTGGTGAGGSSAKPRDCQVDGQTYESGTSFKAADGCNTCSCNDGEVGCTEIGCTNECLALGTTYQDLLERAKSCDPQVANECTQLVSGGLMCACPTFVNPKMYSKGAIAATEQEYVANACGQGVTCGPCPPPPPLGYCTPNGQCADLPDFDSGVACKVGGVIYANGASGIQDPYSCNQCVCQNGELACDDAVCPKPCPDDTKPSKGCAQCGPVDDCVVVDYDCMPTCVETCAKGVCRDGVCVNNCGRL